MNLIRAMTCFFTRPKKARAVRSQSLDLPPAKKWSFEQQNEVTPFQPASYEKTPFNDGMWIPDTERCSSPISESERTLVDEEVYEEAETFDLNDSCYTRTTSSKRIIKITRSDEVLYDALESRVTQKSSCIRLDPKLEDLFYNLSKKLEMHQRCVWTLETTMKMFENNKCKIKMRQAVAPIDERRKKLENEIKEITVDIAEKKVDIELMNL